MHVEEVMELGHDDHLRRLNARAVESILVATSDGRLVGTLYRSDAEARLWEGRVEKADQQIDEENYCCCKD